MNTVKKKKISKYYFVLGLSTIIIGSISVFIAFIFSILNGLTSGQQILIPGTSQITLSKEGTYVIYHEYQSVYDDKVYWTGNANISGLKISLYDLDHESPIESLPTKSSSTYEINGRSGKSLLKFTISQPCKLNIIAEYNDKVENPTKAVFNISQSVFDGLVVKLLKHLIIFIGLCISGGILIYIGYKRRKNELA